MSCLFSACDRRFRRFNGSFFPPLFTFISPPLCPASSGKQRRGPMWVTGEWGVRVQGERRGGRQTSARLCGRAAFISVRFRLLMGGSRRVQGDGRPTLAARVFEHEESFLGSALRPVPVEMSGAGGVASASPPRLRGTTSRRLDPGFAEGAA